MISFIRRYLSSWVVLALFALILLAFMLTGMFTSGSGGIGNLASSGTRIAKIGGYSLESAEAIQRVQSQFDAARQQQPGLDMKTFVAQGGVEQVIDQLIDGYALEAFGQKNGMHVSARSVDAELLKINAFKGPTGSFDRATFLNVLNDRKLTERQVREDFARNRLQTMLIIPALGGSRTPSKLVAPFASLLLETRNGSVAVVPSSAMAKGAAPTDAELAQFYSRNAARYTVPETRTFRYAVFDRARFEGKAAATEAEIAQAYKANAAKYAVKETREFTQAIAPDQKTAQDIVAKVRAGTPLSVAAKAAGSEANTLAAQDQAAFAGLASAEAAKAAFAAAKGAVLDPQKSPFGWNVIRVDRINVASGKTQAQASAELGAEIATKKIDAALGDFVTALEDQIADGATFDEVTKKEGLTVVTTPSVTASGIAPGQPGYKADAAIAPVLREAFLADSNDDAAVVTLAQGKSYAFFDLDQVKPAAPKPLGEIREQVKADFERDRAAKAARKIADAIVAKANGGAPLGTAINGLGVALPSPQTLSAKRIDVARAEGKVPPPLGLLFSIAPKKAKLLEMPDRQGWYVVYLDTIIAGDANKEPALIQATQRELVQAVGQEYLAQFALAVRADRGVQKNDDAIKALKRSLIGATAP